MMRCKRKLSADPNTTDTGTVPQHSKHSVAETRGIIDELVIVTQTIQCCGSHVAAAEAGHLQCLQGLSEAGRFLLLDSPDRASAGEARKLELWNAAFTACKADHPSLLSWLFASGWPSVCDAELPWHGWDMLKGLDVIEECSPVSDMPCNIEEKFSPFMPEMDLYRQAVRNPTSACLEALLEAGCRSVWICRFAAQEGKPAFLALAALRGCPCDVIALESAAGAGNLPLMKDVHRAALLPDGFLSQGLLDERMDDLNHIGVAAMDVTEKGHSACLAALLEWFGAAANPFFTNFPNGGLDCLKTIERAGCLDCFHAATGAAEGAQLECLQYLLDLDPSLVELPLLSYTVRGREASPGTIMDCLEFLQGRGCQWSADGSEMKAAAWTGRGEVLQYCLERGQGRGWQEAMHTALSYGSLECMQVLYDNGYERHRLQHGWRHPAAAALRYGREKPNGKVLECLRLAVQRSGKVDPKELSTHGAFCAGDDVLRYVIELGAPLEESGVAKFAAAEGRVELLRDVLAKGAPLTTEAFECAITANKLRRGFGCDKYGWAGSGRWLECLQCLCEHARAAGFPEGCGRPSEIAFAGQDWEFPVPSLAVLQYVCDHMGPTWAAPVVQATALNLAGRVREAMKYSNSAARPVDWQVVLYLARKLGAFLPDPLGELVAVRRERAAALAGAFFKAGQLAQKSGPAPSAALWNAMARLPLELWQRIAFQAHLVLA
eukprot:jgi/Botrbrau1/7822/Bobra.9_2s0003.1